MDLPASGSFKGAVQLACAAASGVAYGLAYRPLPVPNWTLGLAALIPLLTVLRGVGPWKALWLGWLSGFVAMAIGFSWLPAAVESFMPVGPMGSYAAIVPLWLWHGGRFALFAFCAVRAMRNGWRPWLAFVAAFAAAEALYPMALPWYLAGAVHDAPILLQISDLGGPVVVGVLVLCVNLLVAHAASGSRAPNGPMLFKKESVVLGCIIAAALGYGGLCLVKIYPASLPLAETRELMGRPSLEPRVTLGIIQGNVDPAQKERDPLNTLRGLLLLTKRFAATHAVDAVIWSETSTGYSVDERLLDRWITEVVAPHVSVPMVLGTGIIGDGGRRIYNAAVSTVADGRVVGRYDKQRLFPVGEYMPFGGLFQPLARGDTSFSEGKPRGSFAVIGYPVAVTICYEGLWPGLVRDAVRWHDARLLLNLTNDVRFGDTAEPWGHFTLTKLRAVEQRRYLVRATNSGISAVVDPAGRVTAMTELFTEEAIAVDVFLRSGRTLYGHIGNLPWYGLSVACLVMTLFRRPAHLAGMNNREKKSA